MAKNYCSISVFVILAVGLFHVANTSELSAQFAENVVISPFLLAEGLSLLYLGAEGNSAKELASVIPHFSLNKSVDIFSYLAENRDEIKSTDGFTLKFGNWIFVADDVEILTDYEELIRLIINTNIQHVNFNDAKTVSVINNLIQKQTDNKIINLVDKVSGDDALILVSAIYFKGLWQYPFDRVLTEKAAFYVPKEGEETSIVQVDMMSKLNAYKTTYIKDLDARAIELPYANSNTSMIIILPTAIDGVTQLIHRLPKYDIHTALQNAVTEYITLFLPKFKIEYSIKLNDLLQSIGVQEIFGKANFKSMTNFSGPLHISQVIQKSFIEVNEEGTSAVVAQAITAAKKSIPSFEVNHPFVFFIKDEKRIYFAGQVRNPL